MPIQYTPPRRLIDAYLRLRAKLRGERPEANAIKDGVITAVNNDGTYVVNGRSIPAVGTAALAAGQGVDVAWKDARPKVILAHNARRAQFVPVLGRVDIGIVEELFVFDEEGVSGILFRNFDQFKLIDFVNNVGNPGDSPTDIGGVGTTLVNAQWGKGDANLFMVQILNSLSEVVMIVYRLNRPVQNEPFPVNFKIKARLVQAYNLSTLPHLFGSITITRDGGSPNTATGNLKYIGANYSLAAGPSVLHIRVEGLTSFAGIAPNGDLLVTIHVRGAADATTTTGIRFEMGMILVNVTRGGLVLENRLGSSIGPITAFVSLSSLFVCTPVGTATCSTSLGGALGTAGDITVLSLTGANAANPADPLTMGTFNNYILASPATVFVEAVRVESPPGTPIGEIFCSPTRATITLSIIGEFNAGNENFAAFPGSPLGPSGSRVPIVQGSRTIVQWASQVQGASGFDGGISIRDLKKLVTSSVVGNPAFVFGSAPAGQPSAGNPLMFLTQASLIYSPFDNVTPFNHQFFIGGHNKSTGEIMIDLTALKKLSNLRTQARLAKATGNLAAIAQIGTTQIQVLDSRVQLGPFFQSGPL